MPDPLSPQSPGPSIFGRNTPSVFSMKSRHSPSTVTATVTEEEEHGQVPYSATNASDTSLTSSPGSPRHSLSLRSNKSQYSEPIKVNKGRSPSLTVAPTFSPPSPRRIHRFSRSVSAGVTLVSHSPQKTNQEVRTRPSPSKSSVPYSAGLPSASRNQSIHMLAHMGPSRRPSEAPSSIYAQSVMSGSSSLYGNYTIPPPPPVPSGIQTGFSPLATYNHITETCSKRMATLDYMRKVHEGNCFYFGTISYNNAALSALPSLHPARLGRRATNYLLLGTSIPPLLELHSSSPTEYLRALAQLLGEYDTYCALSASDSGSGLGRGRMGAMLKSGMRNVKGRRATSATDSILIADSASIGSTTSLGSITDAMPLPPINSSGHDFNYLQLPSLPFDPDFNTSFSTLTDVLIDAYAGLLQLLPNADACVAGTAEAFAKADKQLRKVLVNTIANEFENNTRKEAKTEVGGLGKLVLAGLM